MSPSADEPEDGQSVNLEEMAAYMMADLGRGRQEELPLNDRAKGNYKYNPDRRRGGQVRVSKALKNKLAGGWGNPIKDAEAEQMEGLVVEEAPWRKGVERITRATARPLPAAPKLRDNTVAMVVTTPATPAPATPAPATPAPTTSASATSTIRPAFAEELENARAECSFRINAIPEEWEFIIVYYGVLLVRPAPTKLFKASFEIVMFNEPEKPVSARLILQSEGLPSREHDLSSLNAPHVDEDKKCCLLAGSGPIAEHSYYVQLQDNRQTQEFADSLFGLQSVIHDSRNQQPSGSSEPIPIPESTLFPEPTVAIETPAPVSSTPALVELDYSEQDPIDANAIIEAVWGFDQITDALATKHLNPESFKVLDSISEEWYKRKYPKMNASSLLGLISSLQDVFKRHIGIKQHELVCEPGPSPVHVPKSVKDLSGPITYTPSEMEALRGGSRLPELDEETLSPREARMVWKQGLAGSRWSS